MSHQILEVPTKIVGKFRFLLALLCQIRFSPVWRASGWKLQLKLTVGYHLSDKEFLSFFFVAMWSELGQCAGLLTGRTCRDLKTCLDYQEYSRSPVLLKCSLYQWVLFLFLENFFLVIAFSFCLHLVSPLWSKKTFCLSLWKLYIPWVLRIRFYLCIKLSLKALFMIIYPCLWLSTKCAISKEWNRRK